MSEFKREERYKVFKLKDVSDALTYDEIIELNRLSNKVAEHRHYDGRPPLECVYIESDWPIYEEVWDMVQRIAEDREQKVDELKQQIEQAQARIGELENIINEAWLANDSESTEYSDVDWFLMLHSMMDVLDRPPTQALAEIEAQAVEKAIDSVPPKYLQENDYIERLLEYARELRE